MNNIFQTIRNVKNIIQKSIGCERCSGRKNFYSKSGGNTSESRMCKRD